MIDALKHEVDALNHENELLKHEVEALQPMILHKEQTYRRMLRPTENSKKNSNKNSNKNSKSKKKEKSSTEDDVPPTPPTPIYCGSPSVLDCTTPYCIAQNDCTNPDYCCPP